MSETSSTLEDRGSLPAGLVLFPPATPPQRRRRRIFFVASYLAVTAALVWPVYPLMADRIPPILGLPPSFAWVVLVLAAGFAALLALYLTDDDDRVETAGPGGE